MAPDGKFTKFLARVAHAIDVHPQVIVAAPVGVVASLLVWRFGSKLATGMALPGTAVALTGLWMSLQGRGQVDPNTGKTVTAEGGVGGRWVDQAVRVVNAPGALAGSAASRLVKGSRWVQEYEALAAGGAGAEAPRGVPLADYLDALGITPARWTATPPVQQEHARQMATMVTPADLASIRAQRAQPGGIM